MKKKEMNYKISFCIVSMNRTYQLKETFLKNIDDNKTYAELEFILLDYNSTDEMKIWVEDNLTEHLESGRVKYYYTPEPKIFNHSHSKNMAFKLATGDIICNINADHFTGYQFAQYVNECFKNDLNIVLTGRNFKSKKKKNLVPSDLGGKICLRKVDFQAVNGFDERMQVYGYEDRDMINRLHILGRKIVEIDYQKFGLFIKHSHDERYSRRPISQKILICPLSTYSCKLIILEQDNSFLTGTIINRRYEKSGEYMNSIKSWGESLFRLKERVWIEGNYQVMLKDKMIVFDTKKGTFTLNICRGNKIFKNHNDSYYLLEDKDMIDATLSFRYLNNNYVFMRENLRRKRVFVNSESYSKMTLYKNFSTESITI